MANQLIANALMTTSKQTSQIGGLIGPDMAPEELVLVSIIFELLADKCDDLQRQMLANKK